MYTFEIINNRGDRFTLVTNKTGVMELALILYKSDVRAFSVYEGPSVCTPEEFGASSSLSDKWVTTFTKEHFV